MTAAGYAAAAGAAFAAGLVNALAGGGTLISFPVLVALGVPVVAANVTSTVALTAGYLGGTLAQRDDLGAHRASLRPLILTAGLSGLCGAVLLVVSPEALFRRVVPYLILLSCSLLALHEPIKRRIGAAAAPGTSRALFVGLAIAGLYGGYFGAGLGIVLLAGLGLWMKGELTELNAVKQTLSLGINCVAALLFLFSGKVHWGAAAVMALFSLGGGHLGGRIAGRVSPGALRAAVVVVGLAIAGRFLW
jgi:uncharacterized membrane protein YfcA